MTTNLPLGVLSPWLNVALALALAAISALAFRHLRGTTLAAPAAWATAAAATIAAVEALLALQPQLEYSLSGSILRYAASVGTFTPIVAVLGAKRPQDRGWQWVVLSLWVVLLAPAGQAWVARSGSLALSLPWKGLVVMLMAATIMNYGPTRHVSAALAFNAGQVFLLAPYLSPEHMPTEETPVARAFGLICLLVAAAFTKWPPLPKYHNAVAASAGPGNSLAIFNARWLAFRNAWGAFWALRVMQRINETARLSAWPVSLDWRGFTVVDGCEEADVDSRLASQVDQTLDSLLRRFERRDHERGIPSDE
jgi:hypothetical protein